MKRLLFQVCIGEQRPLWNACLQSMAAYCARHGLVHHVQFEPILRIVPKAGQRSTNALRMGFLPIFEKFQSFALLKDYDEILVVDSDVWAQPEAPNLFEWVPEWVEFAAVRECEMPLTSLYRAKVARYAQMQFGDDRFPYYNMGVRLIRQPLLRHLGGQTPTEFIHRTEFADYVNGVGHHRWATEQVLLGAWLRDPAIKSFALPWQWNALYGGVQPERIPEAHFVHFFLSSLLPHDNLAELLKHPEAVARK